MHFGDKLLRSRYEPWAAYYLDYDQLRTLLTEDTELWLNRMQSHIHNGGSGGCGDHLEEIGMLHSPSLSKSPQQHQRQQQQHNHQQQQQNPRRVASNSSLSAISLTQWSVQGLPSFITCLSEEVERILFFFLQEQASVASELEACRQDQTMLQRQDTSSWFTSPVEESFTIGGKNNNNNHHHHHYGTDNNNNINHNDNSESSSYNLLSEEELLYQKFCHVAMHLLRLIQYVDLNITGIRKILKKHDKLCHTNLSSIYLGRRATLLAPMLNNDSLDALTNILETSWYEWIQFCKERRKLLLSDWKLDTVLEQQQQNQQQQQHVNSNPSLSTTSPSQRQGYLQPHKQFTFTKQEGKQPNDFVTTTMYGSAEAPPFLQSQQEQEGEEYISQFPKTASSNPETTPLLFPKEISPSWNSDMDLQTRAQQRRQQEQEQPLQSIAETNASVLVVVETSNDDTSPPLDGRPVPATMTTTRTTTHQYEEEGGGGGGMIGLGSMDPCTSLPNLNAVGGSGGDGGATNHKNVLFTHKSPKAILLQIKAARSRLKQTSDFVTMLAAPVLLAVGDSNETYTQDYDDDDKDDNEEEDDDDVDDDGVIYEGLDEDNDGTIDPTTREQVKLRQQRQQQQRRTQSISNFLNFLSTFLYMTNYYIVAPASHTYAEKLGGEAPQAGLIIGMTPVAALLSTLLYSWWTSYSYKSALIFASVCSLTGNACYAAGLPSQSLTLVLVGRLLNGFGSARSINRRYIVDSFGRRQRTAASATFVTAGSLGMATGPAVAALLEFTVSDNNILDPNNNTDGDYDSSHSSSSPNLYWQVENAPGWIMLVVWTLYLILLLCFFQDPPKRRLQQQKKKVFEQQQQRRRLQEQKKQEQKQTQVVLKIAGRSSYVVQESSYSDLTMSMRPPKYIVNFYEYIAVIVTIVVYFVLKLVCDLYMCVCVCWLWLFVIALVLLLSCRFVLFARFCCCCLCLAREE